MALSEKNIRPGIGVAVFVTNSKYPQCVLVGQRKGKVGSALYQLPGGHLEFGESWEEAGCREVLEETGLSLKNVSFCSVVNSIVPEINYHYVTIFMKGETNESLNCEPQNLEPEKCEGWNWYEWDKIPPPHLLFWPLRDYCLQGFRPF